MPEMTEYPIGSFCWVELATTDAEWAKKFYSELFGWTAFETSSDMGAYTMLQKNGKNVAGMYQMHPERQEGVPAHWESYVSVKSVHESAAKVKQLGGAVLQGPYEMMNLGRMAVVRDPSGAVFALWEPGKNKGADLFNEPGAFCWNELYATDTGQAIRFYSGLFGWKEKQSTASTGEPYIEFVNGEQPVGGMIEIKPEWGPMPPNWMVYFTVTGCDEAIAKAKSLGAKVEVGPMDIANVGRFAMISDPLGAHLAVIEMRIALPTA